MLTGEQVLTNLSPQLSAMLPQTTGTVFSYAWNDLGLSRKFFVSYARRPGKELAVV